MKDDSCKDDLAIRKFIPKGSIMLATTSPARVAANRANAALSTGPKTEAGKTRSRANALKHGLTAQVVALDGVPASTPAVVTGTGKLDPVWVEGLMMRTTVQIDLVYQIERKLRAEAKFRADTYWADDRETDAAALGAKLDRNPDWIVAQLRRCPFGCAWLITQWDYLRLAATNPGGWDVAQSKTAFDLLGVPAIGRDRSVAEAIACRQYPPGPLLSQQEIAEEMINNLWNQMELVEEADDVAQRLAVQGLVDLPTPEVARLRRYDTALKKQLFRLVDYLQANRPVSSPVTTPIPATATAPATVLPRNEANPCETNPTPADSRPNPRC